MNILSDVLLIINVFCLIFLAFLMPCFLYLYFGGKEEKLDNMLEKNDFNFKWSRVTAIALIVLFLTVLIFMIRHSLGFTNID